MHDTDPFDTAELRSRVLDSWVRSAARFREDANAEEDYALDGYRGRVVVELAQNAADAAAAAGGRGRMLLRLRGWELTAANTGAPLTPAGVESLSTLRASAKRGAARSGTLLGRFGTGFAAVVSLSDRITVVSRGGAVTWDRWRASQAVQEHLHTQGAPGEALAEELRRRDHRVPVLRLPFAGHAEPIEDYDTEVRLTLRDEAARAAVQRELSALGEALLLAMPTLTEVTLDTEDGRRRLWRSDTPARHEPSSSAEKRDAPYTVRTGSTHLAGEGGPVGDADGSPSEEQDWTVVERRGRFEAAELADRPTEERVHDTWTLVWALPVEAEGYAAPVPQSARVIHAPTPSRDRLDLAALLIARFPLSPDRRHISAGPATQRLLKEAASAYTELMCAVDPDIATTLIPQRGAGTGEADAALRNRILELLPDTPFLATTAGEPLRPRDAVVVEGDAEVVRALADVVPTALPADRARTLAGLGVGRLGLADLADLCAEVRREPQWWGRLYRALRLGVPATADISELGALPVPLGGGRTVRGPRGVLRVSGEGALRPEALAALGLRVVHPDADDPLLSRLGAFETDAAMVLRHERVRAAVTESLESQDPEAVAEAVLNAARAAGAVAHDVPWLSELALRDSAGEYCPAGELLLPDSPLRDILDEEAPVAVVAADLVERFGSDTLRAVGVMDGFALVKSADLVLDPGGAELDALALDRASDWARHVSTRLGEPEFPAEVSEFAAVRDLEFVRDDRWPQALAAIAGSPPLRAAVTDPVRVSTPDGRGVDLPSYSAWWLGRWARIDGRRPGELRLDTAEPLLHTLLDPVPEGLDASFARALGVCSDLAGLLGQDDGPQTLLERLSDPQREVSRSDLRRLYDALAEVAPERLDPPEEVRGSGADPDTLVVDADDAVVVDAPDLLPLLGDRTPLPVSAAQATALADLLDVALLSEEVPGVVTSAGERREIPPIVARHPDVTLEHYEHHTELRVDGRRVPWRLHEGRVHADGPDGLARAVAWAEGVWRQRHLFAALLREPERRAELFAEAELEE